jgi:hypothetical protein
MELFTRILAGPLFFVEEDRKVSKTNVFSIHSLRYECPVDLREKTIQVRYDRQSRDRILVYFDGKRMGEATVLDLYANARQLRVSLPKENESENENEVCHD